MEIKEKVCWGRTRPGEDIVLCGYVGLEGTLRILNEREEELRERFSPLFIHQAKALKTQMHQTEAACEGLADKMSDVGVSAVWQIRDGGIFAALWDMAEVSGTGLEVSLKKMLIRQETVEICEYYHLNPYQMTSVGSVLFAAARGGALVELLEKAGARAARLGAATAGNARVVTSGSERRFLNRPAPDELMLWHQREMD